MKLKQIKINNFRSIEKLAFDVSPVSESNTYTLLGINESGKSSFLRAVNLIDDDQILFPQDFHDDSKEVAVKLKYNLTDEENKILKEELAAKYKFDKKLLNKLEVCEVDIIILFTPTSPSIKTKTENILFKESIHPNYTFDITEQIIKEKTEETEIDLNLETFFNTILPEYFWKLSHHVTFWKSSSEYLIADEIDLTQFANSPETTSIPLQNCFGIAHIEDISKEIEKLNNSVSIQNLVDKLSDKVTLHINKVWPEHPIKVKFQINSNKLTFLIEDNNVKYKVKTTNQRSDGFRQFISFLLTLSAENLRDELQNSILLLDEPETHLHPSAQINLKNELIKISQNKNNNIVFFATHSNYMIDKENIDRCYKVFKKKNSKTELAKIEKVTSSYSEVNYDVFEIITNDYHNELYGYLEDIEKEKLDSLEKNRKWFNEKFKKIEVVSLQKYIRNSIHHPENTSNKKFTEIELKKSIEIMKKLKYS
jgi:predicted ATP-dependent endonuclease of OLD family